MKIIASTSKRLISTVRLLRSLFANTVKSLDLRYHRILNIFSVKERILIAIVFSYVVELLFTLFEFDAEVDRKWHPFYNGHTFQNGKYWNGWVTNCVFVYGFMEMAARGTMFLAAHWAIRHRIMLRIFVVCATLEMLDMFDYWLFRNDPWFGTPIEFNYIKIGVVIFYARREWKNYSNLSR